MKLVIVALVLGVLALLARPATCAEKVAEKSADKSLRLSSREAIEPAISASVPPPSNVHAPFQPDADLEPVLDLLPHPESRRGSPSSCNGEHDFCYDPANGHIVYKPARQLMPDIPGLKRENISVKRDRVVLRYSF
jgi:hypothetical protein